MIMAKLIYISWYPYLKLLYMSWNFYRINVECSSNYDLKLYSDQLILQPFPSLYLRHSSFYNPSVASPTSQLILQPFFRLSYVTDFHCHLTSRRDREESIVISHLKSSACRNKISFKLGYRAVNAIKYVRCARSFYLFLRSFNWNSLRRNVWRTW